jgi:hypothetical protein
MGFAEEREAADREPGPTTAEVVEVAWGAIEVAWDTIGSLVQGSWRKPYAAASRIYHESTIPGAGIHDPKTWQSHALSDLLIGLSAVNRPPSEDEAAKEAPTQEMTRRSDTGLACSFCGTTRKEPEKLVGGPGVVICDECVDLCCEILADRRDRS